MRVHSSCRLNDVASQNVMRSLVYRAYYSAMIRVWTACLLVVLCAHACMAMPKGFGRKADSNPVLKDDLKYIKCDMCKKVAKQSYRLVKTLRDDLPKWDKLSENTILEQLEHMCKPDKEGSGEWLTKLDIQEDGDQLKVVEMDSLGDCRRECATLARICDELTGEYDVDLSELLYKPSTTRAEVEQALCHDLSGMCNKKPPSFTGPRKDGEEFIPMDEEKLKLKRMMASMSEQGMSGNLFSRDNMMEQMEEYEDQLADYGYDMNDLKGMAPDVDDETPSESLTQDAGDDEGDEL